MRKADVTETFERLSALQQQIEDGVVSVATSACASSPPLLSSVERLMRSDGSGSTPYRLFPLAVYAALTGDPLPAVPVAIMSRFWWTGAETLDDLVDNEFDPDGTGLSPGQAMIAAVACTTLLPQHVILHLPVDPATTTLLITELTATSLSCAGGQIDDLDRAGEPTWSRSMRSYVGKTGAPYERDAVIAARLADQNDEAIRGWRAFGALFGVLRQLANDHADNTAIDAADLSNGVRTLLYAHLSESVGRGSEEAQKLLGKGNLPQSAIDSYLERVDMIAAQLYVLLEHLVQPSDHRDVITWLIQESVRQIRLVDADYARAIKGEN